MTKTEILQDTLRLIEKESEIESEIIVSKCRKTEVVDARCVLVYLLYDKGFYISEIASHLNNTERSISYMLSGISDRSRQNKAFDFLLRRIKEATAK